MVKFLLLHRYGTAPAGWTPAELAANREFHRALDAELTAGGELLDAQALAGPDLATVVICHGDGPPLVADGPFVEERSVMAGYRLVDVDSRERAIQIAARISAAPGKDGKPLGTPIEVRQLMHPNPHPAEP